MRAGQTIALGAGQNIIIDAGASVTIQAGGQSITLSAGGIFSSVPIQLGSAPAPTPAPLMPGLNETLLTVVPAPLSRAQVVSLKRSAPFCEECERCKNGQCDIGAHARSAS
ncbi:MAG: type VI secretion system tip protein VgrG, partial [Pseudomonas paracarnis]